MEKKIVEIEINGKNYIIKENINGLIEYQKFINGKEIDSELENNIRMIYFLIKGANKKDNDQYSKFDLSFDDFIDYIDENMDILEKIGELNQVPKSKKKK